MSSNPFNIAFNAAQAGQISEASQVAVSGLDLEITHVATGHQCKFGSFLLRDFADDISTNYSETTVYGRMDPIKTFQNSTRKIKMGFDLVNSDAATGALSLASVSKLMTFQYPVYEQADNALSISRPPLVRVKFANYIRHQDPNRDDGLLCVMEGCSFSPFDKFELGSTAHIHTHSDGKSQMVPQRISVSLNLVVLHEVPVGFSSVGGDQKWIGGANFYKTDLEEEYSTPAGADNGKAMTDASIAQIATATDLKSELASQGVPAAQQAATLNKVFGLTE
jgi:hypothetical protein